MRIIDRQEANIGETEPVKRKIHIDLVESHVLFCESSPLPTCKPADNAHGKVYCESSDKSRSDQDGGGRLCRKTASVTGAEELWEIMSDSLRSLIVVTEPQKPQESPCRVVASDNIADIVEQPTDGHATPNRDLTRSIPNTEAPPGQPKDSKSPP